MDSSCIYAFDGNEFVLREACSPDPNIPARADFTICPPVAQTTLAALGDAVKKAVGTPVGSTAFSHLAGDTLTFDCSSASATGNQRVWFDRNGGGSTGPAIHKVFKINSGSPPTFTEITVQPPPKPSSHHKPQIPPLKVNADGSLEPLTAST